MMESGNDYCRPGSVLSLSEIHQYDTLDRYRSGDAASLPVDGSDAADAEPELSVHIPGSLANANSTRDLINAKNTLSPNVKKIAKPLIAISVVFVVAAVIVAILASRNDTNENDSDLKTTDGGLEQITSSSRLTTYSSQDNTDKVGDSDLKSTDSRLEQTTSLSQIITSSVQGNTYRSGAWLSWSTWTECGVTCGTGIHVRYRSCNNTGSTGCEGIYKHTEECTAISCPVYGMWNIWSSWGNCDVSCDNGVQTRTRQCVKSNTDDVDCVGSVEQTSMCSHGPCPDCSILCTSGLLNKECNMCVCNQNITGQVVSTTNVRIPGASIYANTVEKKLLTMSHAGGLFTLMNFCTGYKIVVELTGFVTQTVEIGSLTPTLTLQTIEQPYLKTEPRRKARVVGEEVTLCCSAKANPNISYYEWFKDSVLLDASLYTNGTTLSLELLQVSDSGKYSCKGNNDCGGIESQTVDLKVKESPDQFCSSVFTQKRMHLPFDCIQPDTNTATIEVGDCRKDVCRQTDIEASDTCEDQTLNCCTASEFDMVPVQCDGYILSVMKVKGCGCRACDPRYVKISGKLLSYKTRNAVQFAIVNLNGEHTTYTSSKGTFSLTVPNEFGTAVIHVETNDISSTKVIDLSEDTTGTIFTTIYLIESDQIVLIDSKYNNTLYVGDDTANINEAIAEVLIPAHSFVDSSSNAYDGQVYIDIVFLNATSISDIDVMPGVLSTVSDEGKAIGLKTFGAFHISLRSFESNETLFLVNTLEVYTGTIVERFKSDCGLYKLQSASGLWRSMLTDNGVFGQITPTDVSCWITVALTEDNDSQKICYFNIRVYEGESMLSEVTTSRYQTFIQTVHITRPFSFETYGHTFSPSTTCFQTICDDGNGYLEVWISNFEASTDEYLKPSDPAIHSDTGLSENSRQTIEYSVTNANEHLGLRFVSSSEGPFFESETECLAKTETSRHFKFYFQNETENTYTLAEFLEISSVNMAIVMNISQRVWYQKRAEGYRMCFVKVKFDIQNTSNLKIRAISTGGTSKNITNTVLGIRDLSLTSSASACLEYKCSGTIGEDYFTHVLDYTKVTIKHVSPKAVTCVVDSFSQDLIDAFPDKNPANLNSNAFTFYAPTTYSPTDGVYSASTSSGDIELARTIAKGECESGSLMDYNSINPDNGLAVSFVCS